VRPLVGRVGDRYRVERVGLVSPAPDEALELVAVGQLRDDLHLHTGLLFDLADDALFERFVVVDASRGELRYSCVLEDEELAAARDVTDDSLAHERRDEVAAEAPDLGIGSHRDPAAENGPVLTDVLPGLRQHLRRLELDVVADRIVADADDADELRLDPGLLHDFSDRGLVHRLALLDPSAWDDRAELGGIREIEDEQLVEPRLGMLAGDVRGDGRTRSQDCWARIFALCARFFSW
jgi:hypothetical protein